MVYHFFQTKQEKFLFQFHIIKGLGLFSMISTSFSDFPVWK